MKIQNLKLKIFIKEYDIASPDWSKLPAGYPNCDTSCLSFDEKIIWDASYLAWVNEHPIDFIGRKVTNGLITSTAFLIISTIFVSFLYYANINYHLGITFLTDFFA